MLIKIFGIGYEIIVGKLTKEQYRFWSEQSYDDLLNHICLKSISIMPSL